MRGTTPMGADVGAWIGGVSDFWVERGNPPLTDFNYAAESYDAAILIALAVEQAGTDGSEHANHIVDVSGPPGTKCTSFAECRDLIAAGEEIDYDGVSGPQDFNGNGEPMEGSYGILTFGANNRLVTEEVEVDGEIVEQTAAELVLARLPDSAIVDHVPVSVEREGDGILKIGTILPETGNLAFLGPPEFAGVEFAIAEINEAGGVLGNPVEYSQGDSGGPAGDGIAPATATRLLGEDVDAIIGAASSGVTLTFIDQVVTAGVTLFSPANTAVELADHPDNGLYFRNAPNDAMQGAIVADLVIDDGASSVYILNLDDAYGNGIAAVAAGVLEDAGLEVFGPFAYDPNAATFDAEVGDIVAQDPDAIILISFEEGSRILRGAVEQGIGPQNRLWYGTDGNMGNALGENFDAA